MITKEQAINLGYRTIIHYGVCSKEIGLKGRISHKIEQWRVNGLRKTWKKEPEKFSVPIKNGLYSYGYLTNYNCSQFHLLEDCEPIDDKNIHNLQKVQG